MKRTKHEQYEGNKPDKENTETPQQEGSEAKKENPWSDMSKNSRMTAAERLHEKAMAGKLINTDNIPVPEDVEVVFKEDYPLDSRAKIRVLNDRLRKTGEGGVVVVTQGVLALDETALTTCLKKVQEEDLFDDNNDTHSEHDFGIVEYGEISIIWKIDYYDLDLLNFSPDPTDEHVTKRVMTIMLPSEY